MRKITDVFKRDKDDRSTDEKKSIESRDDKFFNENDKSNKKEKKDKKLKSEKKDKDGKKDKKGKKHKALQSEPEQPKRTLVTNIEPIATQVPIQATSDLIGVLNKGIDERNKVANATTAKIAVETIENISQTPDNSLLNMEALLYLQHLKKAVDNWTDEGSYYFKSSFVPPGIRQFRNDLISLPSQENTMPLFHQIIKKLYELSNSNNKEENKGLSLYKTEYSTVMQNFPDYVESILNTYSSYKFRPGHL